MPYIGQQPAPKVVTSSDLADDVVTADKIGDTAISGFTALGATPADTDELLVSDAGTLKRVDFSHLKGGGVYELIQTQTISSAVAQVDFTSTQLTTTYVDYLIVFTGAKLAGDGASLRLRVSTNGGSSFDSSSNYVFATQGRGSDGSSRTSNGNADSKINLHTGDMGSATGRNFSGFVECFDPLNQTSDDKFFIGTYRMVNWDSNGYLLTNFGGFSFDDSGSEDTVFNGLRFLTSSGNISQGVFSIYGRKTS